MIAINIDSEIKEKVKPFALGVIECNIRNSEPSETLWELMNKEIALLKEKIQFDSIKENPAIKATREAYKACGKDPSRYRPSAEALCRRIFHDMDLYRINTVVDLINLVSFRYGYSIGGFDRNKIKGDVLVLGIGKADEPFEGIGRGLLNIEGLPVYRDMVGGIGTPTSDHERTKLTIGTTRLLMIINGYFGINGLGECITYSKELLTKFAAATEIEEKIIEIK
ncbi:MAG TPA: phenylalanine--tRNA ligase beta subunit-related protein [Paludibacteraceae bacterium]|nr:phenylalanine--tRNA ligase beta subunit-related protein [Paludibacteraceae bacterium]